MSTAPAIEHFHKIAVSYEVDLRGVISRARLRVTYWPELREEERVVAERPFGGRADASLEPRIVQMLDAASRFETAIPFVAQALARALPSGLDRAMRIRLDITHAVRDDDGQAEDLCLWVSLVEQGIWIASAIAKADPRWPTLIAEGAISHGKGDPSIDRWAIASTWTDVLEDPDLGLRALLTL